MKRRPPFHVRPRGDPANNQLFVCASFPFTFPINSSNFRVNTCTMPSKSTGHTLSQPELSDTVNSPSPAPGSSNFETRPEPLVMEQLMDTPSNRPRRSMTRGTQYKELGSSSSASEAEFQLGSKEASECATAADKEEDWVGSDPLTEAEEEADATPMKKPTMTYKERGRRTKAEMEAARRQGEDRRKDFKSGSWEYMALTEPCIPHHDNVKWDGKSSNQRLADEQRPGPSP